MSHLLLPIEGPGNKPSDVRHKPTELPRQLFYIVRGGTDAVEALELFLELHSEPSIAESKTMLDHSGYLAFDAHVGDTACQLRACMLLELTKHLKKPMAYTTVDIIRSTVRDLRKVVGGGQQLMMKLLELDWKRIQAGGLEKLSIPKAGLTTDELLAVLGWFEVRQKHFQYDDRSASSSESLNSQDAPASMSSSMSRSNAGSSTHSLPEWDSETSDGDEEFHGVSESPFNIEQILRFIVYSYVLSKYKQLTTFGGVYRATLKPELAFERGHRLIEQEFGRQFVRPNKRAIGEEFTVLQRYLSDLSCSWLKSQVRKSWSLPSGYHSLLTSTIRTSAKGVSSASSYVGYLVLRSRWAEESHPIVITTTRFCPFGFHRNYFKVATCMKRDDGCRQAGSPDIPDISWQLTRLVDKDLEHMSQSLEPHIMVSGNSIDGDVSGYYDRLPNALAHGDDQCCDNAKHCDDMLVSDQDRVVQAIFAEHRHYAFELPGEEATLGEDYVVQHIIKKSIQGLSAAWAKSKEEAACLGTGPSYKLYMWQHVALESPARFLARVEGSNRPWIISAAV